MIKKLKLSKKPQKTSLKKSKKNDAPVFEGQRGFTDTFGYIETDPYIFAGNGTVISVFDVLFQYGTNSPAPTGWVNMVLPRDQIKHGVIEITQRQQGMEKSTETAIVDKTLGSYTTTLANDESTKSARDNEQNRMRIRDMKLSAQLSGGDDSIVDSDMRLVVKADTPEDVELAIEELKADYKNNDVKGVILNRRTGRQLQDFSNLLSDVSADGWHSSDMVSVSAGRLFLPSSGFSDKTGVFIGTDVRSLLSNNPAIVDFQKTRNAVVFMGGVKPIVDVYGQNSPMYARSGGSAVAQVIADSNYLAGQRTHHILVSPDLNYRSPDSLYFDMTKESINPLEVFGRPETVQFDTNTNISKVVTMMSILSDTGDDRMTQLDLESLLRDWFIYRANGSGLYTTDPELEPHKALRILATPDHENYPRLTAFLTELNGNMARASNSGEKDMERARLLYSSIRNASRAYSFLFDKSTSLPDSFKANDRNIYYDLSKVSEDKRLKGMMLINTLAYVTNRALEGEMIVVHGLDSAEFPPESIAPYRERIDNKGIGLITVYEQSENTKINPKTCVRFSGRLSKQDVVVIGGVTKPELEYINDSWQQPLPEPVSQQLLASVDGILYFYRESDRVGALINTRLTL